jgi:hypothetical protein
MSPLTLEPFKAGPFVVEADMNLLIALLTALLSFTQHPSMPAGMSHEEHLKQLAKDEALKKRGGEAMGFDQDATEHHFIIEAGGGSIQVTMKPGADAAVLAQVRSHLRTIAVDFARGDFSKPFQTHGEVPPGVEGMKSAARAITYRYEDVALGGVVRIRTTDANALRAVHDFLRYQITEHHTGPGPRLPA